MSDNPETNTTDTGGKRRRNIQMKHFITPEAQKAAIDGKVTRLGQIIGVAFGARVVEGELPDGTSKKSIQVMGEFEALSYAPGSEAVSAGSIWLPDFFAQELMVATEKSQAGVQFAIEILCEPSTRPGGVPYQYGVASLLPREANNPIEQMKARLKGLGRLAAPGAPPPALEAPKTDESVSANKGARK